MKPWNLEEVLAGKPTVMRNGNPGPPKLSDLGSKNKLYGLFNDGVLYWNRNDGRWLWDGKDHPYDLFMDSAKQERWVVVLRNPDGYPYPASRLFTSEKDAKLYCPSICVAVCRIEWEE